MKDILIKLLVLLIVLLAVLVEADVIWLILKHDFEIEVKMGLVSILVMVPVTLLNLCTSNSSSNFSSK